ncbi:MAG: LysR family transcriptional regulator, partial [Burkholderiales bacterium]|nr:LysR family transcriptional regulator [Burkholderiales bacterium]
MTRPLDPISLQHFISVCEERSIARAAARESLVPSALSKRMAALESELGLPLLVRRRNGIEPTPAGQALLARAREVLGALDQLRVELDAFAQGAQGSVRVLASPSVLAEDLPDDIAVFLELHPAVRVSLDERYSREIVQGVREGIADLGVLWDLADLSGLQAVPYRRDRLCVAMAATHPLARRESLTLAQTLAHPSINVSPGGQMDQLVRRHAALLGVLPTHRMQVGTFEAACRLVAAGLGLAILPREAAAPYTGAGRLALVPLDEPWAERRFVIVARPAPLSSSLARLLADHLCAAASPR